MSKKSEVIYLSVTVESAKSGWIVRAKGEPAEVFVRWEDVVKRLKHLLTTVEVPYAM